MNNLDEQYQALLQDILDNGVTKADRTGTGTISVFGRQIRHNMKDGFPLLTTKKMAWKTMATELIWFLRGDTNIQFLVQTGCNIWNGDAYKNYVTQLSKIHSKYYIPMEMTEFIERIKTDDTFAKEFGELGPIYGAQWRNWNNTGYSGDQIQNLINELKTNPDSRRLMVNAWNVGELDQMVLPPCHYGFQVYTRELRLNERGGLFRKTYPNKSVGDFKPNGMEIQSMTHQLDTRYNNANIPTRAISLMWNQRSVDTFLGLPFNIASYGLLLEIIAKMVNMVPDQLVGNLGDTHLYLNHLKQAQEQIGHQYSLDERRAMVTQEMFNEMYNGGDPSTLSHSEIDQWGVPRVADRESYTLPKLVINSGNANWHLLELDEIINTLDPDITFKVEGYKSHPSIKAPLSN